QVMGWPAAAHGRLDRGSERAGRADLAAAGGWPAHPGARFRSPAVAVRRRASRRRPRAAHRSTGPLLRDRRRGVRRVGRRPATRPDLEVARIGAWGSPALASSAGSVPPTTALARGRGARRDCRRTCKPARTPLPPFGWLERPTVAGHTVEPKETAQSRGPPPP